MTEPRSSLFARATRNLREYRRLTKGTADASQTPQDYGVYVLNLERSPERRRYISAHLPSVGVTPMILNAVDGKKLDYAALITAGKYSDQACFDAFSRKLLPAEVGCSLSHVSAYEALLASNDAFALVVEDDAQFSPDARTRIDQLLQEAPRDWGVIQLRFDSSEYEQQSQHLVRFTFGTDWPVSATAYLISRAAAATLMGVVYPIRYPADSLLGRANTWNITVFGAWPEIVGVNNVFPSSIQGNRNWRFRLSNLAKRLILRIFG
jgi:glycosyl transferase, family 25